MSDTGHDLHSDFPGDAEILSALKRDNAHFHVLADRYHQLNKAVVRAETNIEPTSDAHMEDLKKERLATLDEIAAMIAQAKAPAG